MVRLCPAQSIASNASQSDTQHCTSALVNFARSSDFKTPRPRSCRIRTGPPRALRKERDGALDQDATSGVEYTDDYNIPCSSTTSLKRST